MILRIAGGGVLILMLLAAAFALGVYVGEHGWTREGLAYGPGAGVQQGAANPNGAAQAPRAGTPQPTGRVGTPQTPLPNGGGSVPVLPAGLPPGPPQLNGRIRQVTAQRLDLAAAGGPRTVLLDEHTQYRDSTGQPITIRELKPGDIVAVFGVFLDGDGGRLMADFVVVLPAAE
jgi:hypothetical protein